MSLPVLKTRASTAGLGNYFEQGLLSELWQAIKGHVTQPGAD